MATVREQLGLGLAYGDAGVDLRVADAADNKNLPIHRWVPWIAGFSAQFAEDAINAYLPDRRRGQRLVLDPFAGVGTTLVEALKAGCDTTGYEINAFARLAAEAKVNSVDVSPAVFQTRITEFRTAMTEFEAEADERWARSDSEGLAPMLEGLSAKTPGKFRSRIPFFSPPIEAKFLNALHLTDSLREPERSLFRCALGATMVTFSNYTYEPSLSSRPGAGKPLIENASVMLHVTQKLDLMLEDIELAKAQYGGDWRLRRRTLFSSSYLESKLRKHSVSLMVTSPPYMNNYHYVRNTRPQLYWLGLVEEPEDLRRYEDASFGKFWQTVRQNEPAELEVDLPTLLPLVQRLRHVNVERGVYGGPGWANYVVGYFNDCDRFLQLAARQLKPGARAVIVLGNSIIQGIEFKVDELLAELAETRGLSVEEIRIVRTKRVGNSIIDSAVRNGTNGDHKKQTKLYDSAVILRA